MTSIFSPCSLVELSPNYFGIVYIVAGDRVPVLQQHGGLFLAQRLEAMLRALLRSRHMDLPDVAFKCDDNVLAAMSWDLSSLQVIAHMIRELLASPDLARHSMDQAMAAAA